MHPSVPTNGNALFLSSITPLLPAVLVVLVVLVAPNKKKSRDTLRYHGSTLLYTFVIL